MKRLHLRGTALVAAPLALGMWAAEAEVAPNSSADTQLDSPRSTAARGGGRRGSFSGAA